MKYYCLIIGINICLCLASCTSAPISVSEKLRIVVDNFERNSENCSAEQFAKYEMQYNLLLDEMLQQSHTMSSEEKMAIAKDIARYNGLLVRYHLQSRAEQIKGIYEMLPSITEGFIDGVKSNNGLEDIENSFKEMLEEAVKASEQIKIKEGNFEQIRQSLDNMINDATEASEKIDSIFKGNDVKIGTRDKM